MTHRRTFLYLQPHMLCWHWRDDRCPLGRFPTPWEAAWPLLHGADTAGHDWQTPGRGAPDGISLQCSSREWWRTPCRVMDYVCQIRRGALVAPMAVSSDTTGFVVMHHMRYIVRLQGIIVRHYGSRRQTPWDSSSHGIHRQILRNITPGGVVIHCRNTLRGILALITWHLNRGIMS